MTILLVILAVLVLGLGVVWAFNDDRHERNRARFWSEKKPPAL